MSSRAFERALSRFKISLTPAEENDFKISNLQDVTGVIRRIQQDQVARNGLMNLNRIKPFLEGVEQYGAVIEVFLNTSSILAFVWVRGLFWPDEISVVGNIAFAPPPKLVSWTDPVDGQKTASNMVEAFDKLLEAYEMLGESIPQFEQYESIFRNDSFMRKVLELFYVDVLDFHRHALKVFNRRGWKLVFKSMWKDFKATFQNILDNLQRHKRLVETQASLAEFEAAQKARTETENNFSNIREVEKKRQLIAVTQWLAPANSNVDQEKFTGIRNLYPGTGHWLFDDDAFKTWYDPLSTAGLVFWLYGIPGAGKTILASLIVERARKLPSTSLCFFYCKHGDANKNTFDSVARGILVQLLHQNKDLLRYFYDNQVESSEVTLKSNGTLEELLRTALENAEKPYIVIDGLDECEKVERNKILGWFIPAIKSAVPGHVRVIFISRNEDDIGKKLSKASYGKKRINSKDNSNDMRTYLQTWAEKIQRKFGLSDTRKSEIVSTVFERADGMFLFSYLVMDNLFNQTTEEELDRELSSNVFPTVLGQAYARVVDRIYNNTSKSEKAQAEKLLGWIVCSKRPLKWHEIQGAVSIDLEDRTVNPKRRLRVTVKELCGSLVEVQEDTVELVHATAKFHLIDMKLVDVAIEDINLATLCVQYLTFDCFDIGLSDDQIRRFMFNGDYSFQDYAAVYWIQHVEDSGQQIANYESDDFGKLIGHLRKLLDKHWGDLEMDPAAPPAIRKRFRAFRKFDMFEWLLVLAQSKDHGASRCSTDGIRGRGLSIQIQKARSALEKLASLEPTDPHRRHLRSVYGPNWFRCEVLHCQFFYKGFLSAQAKEKHERTHKRPFRCTHDGCHIADIGCPSERELQEHLIKFHPIIPEDTVHFPAAIHENQDLLDLARPRAYSRHNIWDPFPPPPLLSVAIYGDDQGNPAGAPEIPDNDLIEAMRRSEFGYDATEGN